jgi:hypothetical protein
VKGPSSAGQKLCMKIVGEKVITACSTAHCIM